MDPLNPQAGLPPEPKKSAVKLYLIIFLVLLSATLVFFAYKLEIKNQQELSLQAPVVHDETANWQTYRNQEYGFEFKQPEGWEVQSEGLITFRKRFKDKPNSDTHDLTGACKVTIHHSSVFTSETNPDLAIADLVKEINSEIKDIDGMGGELLGKAPISVASIEGVNVLYRGIFGNHTSMFLVPLNQGAMAMDVTCGDDVITKGEEISQQILSTFKFTDSTSDWKTYRNEELGFEFKLPHNWEVILFEPHLNLKGLYIEDHESEYPSSGISVTTNSNTSVSQVITTLNIGKLLNQYKKIIGEVEWSILIYNSSVEPEEYIIALSQNQSDVVRIGSVYTEIRMPMIEELLATFKFIGN